MSASEPGNAGRPRTILITALGGQGGGVLTEWLVEAATRAGYLAQATSIPGVAQRTGATTYYVEVHPQPVASLAGRTPILGLYPVPGGVDLLVASELLEAVRMVQGGMASPGETLLVASISRTLTTVEKMALTDGRFDSAKLLEVARAYCRRLVAFDMEAVAREAGTAISAVMAGTIAGSGVLPFASGAVEAAIRASGMSVAANLLGFERGIAAMTDGASAARPVEFDGAAKTTGPTREGDVQFPAQVRDIVGAGIERVTDFQDRAYAELYLRRLRRILAVESAIDPGAEHGHALTRESARFLALWMAFDDVARVAALKSRAARFARVRREVGARAGDIVRIADFFKPGVPELAGMLPPGLARRLVAWDRRRQQRGRLPLAWPLRIRADSASGFLALRVLASCKWLRRRGLRCAEEQALIERWLAAIESAARSDWQTAHEIALCGRLIKGYGATNERGKRNLVHILDHVARGGAFASETERAAAIRSARDAALADESGKTLDATLVSLGAPRQPPAARPVVFVRRKPASEKMVAR
ncbi:MAG TPA: indolepyruvate oxidoreductase subunit beta family protein [Casimicrobiaceae bacterium]|nr:indolepyruvate oxidoreductase subunit beta family protein [Casimicrobiaceae bacterium]